MKNKRLFQGMGIGYIVCLATHVIAALLPMYVVMPFAGRFFDSGCCHEVGLLDHIVGDILILTMVLVPVALLTWGGHKLVRYFKCKCGVLHEKDPCSGCVHKRF